MSSTSTLSYKCPNCGAGLIFDPDKQKFCCEFCLSDFTENELEKTEAAEQAKKEEQDAAEFCDNMKEYYCSNCGAKIIADNNTVADFCYFCHNPVVLNGKLSGQIKPDKIIPFKFDKESAEEQFLKYAKKKWFVPSDFFSKEHAGKISGVYFPFWVTDADTDGSMHTTATKVRKWRSANYLYTETSRYNIQRAGEIHFEDIVTSAISDADKAMLEGILPFPSDSLIDFSIPYLLGYTAKKRDIDRETIIPEVRARMCSYANELFMKSIKGYTVVNPSEALINVKKSHWEYALMPIWILTYKHKNSDKIFTYAMNGYTGKIYGELPLSIPKLAILFGSVFIASAILSFLAGGFLL